MTHNVLSQDQQDLHARIDQEAAPAGASPRRRTALHNEIAEFLSDSTDGLINLLDLLPRVVFYSVWSLVGTGIVMASVAHWAPVALAAEGMVIAFFACSWVSLIYWLRYEREQQTRDEISNRLDAIMEAIAETDHVVNEKLDAVVRNV